MKRLVATGLWFYSFWYLGSMIAGLLGVPDLLGPLLGTAAGIFIGADPRGLIWNRSTPSATVQGAVATASVPNAA
ncbi:MAG TPA: hypothetical protein VFV53_06935 [Candidatus Limnocylindrales bacterium]|nr:hypothetical protein [Candidatus Limnocylindrales bacterium]